MMTDEAGRVTVSREIAAPADDVFAVLADPARHPAIDGSGMLRSPLRGAPVSSVGDEFVLGMHNDEMGEYEMTNEVVDYEPGRRIAWEPYMTGAARSDVAESVGLRCHHVWGFELQAGEPGTTVVTEYYDCSRSPEWLRTAVADGAQWLEAMTTTLELLERQCTSQLRR